MGVDNFQVILDGAENCLIRPADGLLECLYTLEPLNPRFSLLGCVNFHSDKSFQANHLKIKFKGEARVRWTTGSKDNRTTHIGNDVFVKKKIYLFENEHNNHIQQGQNTIRFRFDFDERDRYLPHTCCHMHGHITYSLEAELDKKGKFFDYGSKVLIFMQSYVPIPPQYLPAMQDDGEYIGCCLCCASGPIIAKVKIPTAGYQAGEQVPVEIIVDNSSGSKITYVVARVGEYLVYRSNGGRTTHGYEKVSDVAEGPNIPNNTRGQRITLTPTINPFVGGTLEGITPVLTRTYVLKVNVDGCKIHIPIFVGKRVTPVENPYPQYVDTGEVVPQLPQAPPPGYGQFASHPTGSDSENPASASAPPKYGF